MAEEKKAPETEEKTETEEKKTPEVEEKDKDGTEAPKEQTEDKGENEDKSKSETEDKPEKSEDKPKVEQAVDSKDEEILQLKTQIVAMQLGIGGEYVEDAVAMAESYVKSGKAADVNAALSAVVKKYPDMKAQGNGRKSQGGFKVGADTSEKPKADDEKLSKAFGIKKK